jgi:lysophospholipase L1-like esterase
VLLQIGESDYQLGTSTEKYRAALIKLLNQLRKNGVKCSVIASVSSNFGANGYLAPRMGNSVRIAQTQAAAERLVLLGPDTDTLLGESLRYDGVHPSGEGLRVLASAWTDAIQTALRRGLDGLAQATSSAR